jgi:hypothetical protein
MYEKNTWPKRNKLIEAIDVVWRFQQMCSLQLDIGNWATMDFPTKHHINRILSVQYTDTETLHLMYGKKLTEQAMEVLPVCKLYLQFISKPVKLDL